MSDQIRILVADDHTILRQALCDSLRSEPDLEIVAEAGDGQYAVELAVQHQPDIALLDVEMPGQKTLTTVTQLRERCPDTSTVILTMHDSPGLVQEFLELGISGFLHKSATRATLISAIRAACSADQQVTMSVSRKSLKVSRQKPTGPGALSNREIEVLNHVAAARSNRQTAASMGIAEGTVKRHMRNIFEKLDAVSRIDAVNKAMAASVIRTDTSHTSWHANNAAV
ncbi:response regulator transcription factor [Kitasatospora sp. NPDC096128]|uniref:response regulator transcription factor n=1 Tax=Kitasatospora sp. NPDC096128 TaxID=3155547 RepID=UPI003333F519